MNLPPVLHLKCITNGINAGPVGLTLPDTGAARRLNRSWKLYGCAHVAFELRTPA